METNTTRENQQAQRSKAQDLSSISAIKNEVETIRQTLSEATKVPLKPKLRVVDAGSILDSVSRLSTGLGKAFAKAESIAQQESEILRAAREAANKMADQAEQEVNQAQEEKARILREAEAERSAILEKAQQEYEEMIAQAKNRENIVQAAQEEVRRCAVKCDEMVLDAQNQQAQIIEAAHAEKAQIIEDAGKRADALVAQATQQADKAVSVAIGKVSSYSREFDNNAERIVETLRNVQVLVDLLNESGQELGDFARDMAEQRDRLLHPEYFEE